MNHDQVLTGRKDQTTGHEIAPGFRVDSRLNVTVISTTPEGTLAALKAAARLAKNLDAPITLATIQVLPSHLPLDRPDFIIELLEKRAFAMVSDAGIREHPVTIQIWFCHDQKICLRQALGPRTLAVIGGTKRWWRRDEWKLEEWLGREGYPTIFADVEAKGFTEILPKSHRKAILYSVVKNPGNKTASTEAR